MICTEAEPGNNTNDTTKVARPTQKLRSRSVGTSVTTASRSRDEWDEGKQRSSYVARGKPRHSISTSEEQTNHVLTAVSPPDTLKHTSIHQPSDLFH